MNILVISQVGKHEVINSDFVPRVGDKIDLFYEPLPEVTQVVAWPSNERLKAIGLNQHEIDAIVTAE